MQTNTNAGKTIAAAVFVALAVSTTSATADFILQPNSVNAYSPDPGANPTGWVDDINYKGIYTWDGTGLSNASLVANGAVDIGNAGTNLAAMPTHSVMFDGPPSAGRYNPAANRASPLLLQYSVDKTYDFTGVYLWNYAEYYGSGPFAGWYNNRGISQANIGFYGDSASGFAFRGSQIVNFTETPQALNNGPQYVRFSSTIPNAQFIAFYINSTFEAGTNITADTITGLNEIRFTAVPEPTTWALLAGGLATVMTLRRRLRPSVSCPKI